MLHYKTFTKPEHSDWVVLIHGAGGSSSIFFKQIREYRKHFNILIVDLRGHGKSKDPLLLNKEYTMEEISKDVLHVLDELHIEKAHFVGISLGTIIIRIIADLQPERVKSAVLGGAVTRLTTRPRILMRLGYLVKNFVPYMWLYKLFAFTMMPKNNHAHSRFMFIQEAKKLAQKEFMKWYSLTANINQVLKYYEEKESDVPMLYIMGSEDYMFLPPVKAVCKKVSNVKLVIIEDVGHVCNVDAPELFNKETVEFMKAYI